MIDLQCTIIIKIFLCFRVFSFMLDNFSVFLLLMKTKFEVKKKKTKKKSLLICKMLMFEKNILFI